MSNEFTITKGMIVWLKTGGPAMSVKRKAVNGEWYCTWFDKNSVKEHGFAVEQLINQDPNPQPHVEQPLFSDDGEDDE
ncbi:hypothetical protein D3C80_2059480 [compost metagenome]